MFVSPMQQLERLRIARTIKKNVLLRSWKDTAKHNYRIAYALRDEASEYRRLAKLYLQRFTGNEAERAIAHRETIRLGKKLHFPF